MSREDGDRFKPGDLAWIKAREKGPVPIRAGSSIPDASTTLADGVAVTVVRRAMARDYGDWWRKTSWGVGVTYAGRYSKVSWLVSSGMELWLVLDDWLSKRVPKA